MSFDAEDFGVTLTQSTYYQGKVLMLTSGKKPMLTTFGRDGSVDALPLHLPRGMEAKSLLTTDQGLFLRAWDGPQTKQLVLVQVDPQSGMATRMINTPQLPPNDIVCGHAGKYIGLHWVGDAPDNQKAYFMVGSE